MSERYSRIFTLPAGLHAKESPIIIKAGALLRDNDTNCLLAQLKLCNISDKTIKFAKVEITCLDSVGRQIGNAVIFEYLDISVSRDVDFGVKTPIRIAQLSSRSYTVRVVEVGFSDNSVWVDNGNEWISLPSPRGIETVIKDTDTLTGYKAKYGKGASYEALVHNGVWFCTCGGINREGEERCHICNAELNELLGLNYDEMMKEGIYRSALELSKHNDAFFLEKAIEKFAQIEAYKDSAEQIKRINDLIGEKSEKKKKQIKKFSIIISALVCSCLLGYFVAYPLISYWSGNYKVYINMYNVEGFEVPDGVTSIDASTLSGCDSLTSIVIPDSVTSIGEDAFSGWDKLKSVEIPDSVTSVGEAAFYGCSSLKSVTIGDSVTSIDASTFGGCDSLASVVIPDSVIIIGKDAFYGCSNLTSVTIGDSVTSIGNYAFFECSSLTSVEMPDSVTIIGKAAFYGCSNLASMTIGDSVTSIGEDAFSGCSSLKSVEIPDSVTKIGESAFYGCSSLERIVIPFIGATKNNTFYTYFGYIFGAQSYSGNFRYVPESLKTVIITGETSIGESAFSGCSNLTSVVIPESVMSIGDAAFADCSNLMSVVIPESVTSIGDFVFDGCSNLTSVTMPDGVTSIGNYAFAGCSNLTSVTIPDSVTIMGDYAFVGCSNLTIVNYTGNFEQWEKIDKGSNIGYFTQVNINFNYGE